MPQKGSLTIDGATVAVSNLDKVLYPAAQFTKAQVIDYYIRVAEFLLPHLKDRPVTLKRYPDGVRGEHFYEKDAPGYTPDWVQTFPVPRRAGGADIRYILINDLRTLVWAANLANLEIHPFLHRAPEINTPTHVVFDLDPGEAVDVLGCAEVARLLKQRLDRIKLKSFAKVSGSKGIQIYVPLNHPDATYALTGAFARSIAEEMEQQHPMLVVSKMAKELRKGKVFIDWSQNADFKTTVGVYSLRAKRSHPFVSMPVEWRELATKDADQLYFDPEKALGRLERKGDLFAPVLELQQALPGMPAARSAAPKTLKTYAAKRNFAKTAEPAPKSPRRSSQGGRRRFVIQKHAATHLHYDFRLEMHDVLKSWAVPKGVPYALDERRLAAATEDHPIDYLEFEGTIPEGQYGGGTVMVWDIGTYELIEGNYYKGYLHLFLSGKKLKGEWLLQKDRDSQKNWRLTKAGKAVKPVTERQDDRSALSGRTMRQIAEARDAEWHSNRTRAGIDLDGLPAATPSFIEPMKAKPGEVLPEGDQWIYEVKLDGYRALAVCGPERVQLLSRRNNSLNDRFPAIVSALERGERGTVFDGEVGALDAGGRPSFNVLPNRGAKRTPMLYYVFDLLVYRGRSLAQLPLTDRRRLLTQDAMAHLENPVLLSTTLEAPPDELLRAVQEQGLEGIVAKRKNSTYEAGKRSGAWIKVRVNKGQELVIGGYKPGKNGFDYLLAGYYDDEGGLIFIAKVKNGFTPQNKKEITARFEALETQTCPFSSLPEPRNARRGEAVTATVMAKLRWLRPELVAQVEFVDWTDADHLRHSRFAGLRDDKPARDVRKEV